MSKKKQMLTCSAWLKEKHVKEAIKAKALLDSESKPDGITILSGLVDQGSTASMVILGDFFRRNSSLYDEDRAAALYRRAYELGSTIGLYKFGLMLFRDGKYSECEDVFLKGARRQYPPATYWLARLYFTTAPGFNRLQDAKVLLEQASLQGHIWASRDLATLYFRGNFGNRKFASGLVYFIRGAAAYLSEAIRDRQSPKLLPSGAWDVYSVSQHEQA